MRSSFALKVVGSLVVASVVMACAEDVVDADPRVPQVTALSAKALVVGEPLSVYGQNFLEPDVGVTKLVFEGKFFPQGADGTLLPPENVAPFTIQPIFDGWYPDGGGEFGVDLEPGTTVVRWNRFGPFRVPFGSSGDKPGTFKGTVTAINHFNDGETFKGEPSSVSIDVKASVIITLLEPIKGYTDNNEPIMANCGAPALRGLGGLPYVMEVQAIGFTPDYFIWEVSNVNGKVEWSKFTHPASSMRDRLGDPKAHPTDPPIFFNPIADQAGFNLAAIRVTAVDKNGTAYHTALPLSIVRPMAFNYDGNRELAEYYEPEAVSGCVVGAIGSDLTYAETHSEARQRGVSIGINNSFSTSQTNVNSKNWSEGVSSSQTLSATNSLGQSHSESQDSTETYGVTYNSSQSTSNSYSTTKGSNWGWSSTDSNSNEEFLTKTGEVFGSVSSEVSASVTGEGSIPGFAKVSGTAGTKFGAEVGAKTGNQKGEKVGSAKSVGSSTSGSETDQTAFGSVTVDGQSQNMGGAFALGKQSSINATKSQTEANSNSVSFDVGGAKSVSQGVVEGKSETWNETWQTTTTDSTLVGYKSKVPNGRAAVIYRQTVRYVRRAQLYSYDLCGVRSLVGEAVFNEWTWSPNIAIGNTCDKLPPSTLPKAHCFSDCE